jgi:hypothetical protein
VAGFSLAAVRGLVAPRDPEMEAVPPVIGLASVDRNNRVIDLVISADRVNRENGRVTLVDRAGPAIVRTFPAAVVGPNISQADFVIENNGKSRRIGGKIIARQFSPIGTILEVATTNGTAMNGGSSIAFRIYTAQTLSTMPRPPGRK